MWEDQCFRQVKSPLVGACLAHLLALLQTVNCFGVDSGRVKHVVELSHVPAMRLGSGSLEVDALVHNVCATFREVVELVDGWLVCFVVDGGTFQWPRCGQHQYTLLLTRSSLHSI